VSCPSDSTNVVVFIQKDLNVHHKYENLIMAIKHLYRDWLLNAVVDFIAKKSPLSDCNLIILKYTPPVMTSALLTDAMDVEFVRP